MATYAFGDIQGCIAPLEALLDKINYDTSKDQLWFTGDLINRGPDSLRTLRVISKLPNTICVLGNHDLHLLALKLAANAYETEHNLSPILEANDCDELIDWLRHRPLLHHDCHLGYTMVHAGIFPTWSIEEASTHAAEISAILQSENAGEFLEQMYGNEPDTWSNTLTGWERLRFITNVFTRMRFCDSNGSLILDVKGAPDARNPNLIPWYKHPLSKNRDQRIIFGHWAALMGKADTPNIFALDTGCVWGNQLTALRLEDQQRFCVNCEKTCSQYPIA